MGLETLVDDFRFNGAYAPPLASAADGGPWVTAITKTAGAPTIVAANGKLKSLFTNDSEIQNLCLYFGDNLAYDIDDLISAEFWVDCPASLDSATSIAVGMCSARNNDPDALAANAMFRLLGGNSLIVETDDGTNDTDDKSTGLTLGTTTRKLMIDFATGVKTQAPPSLSVGGKGNVLFAAENDSGLLTPVARNVAFDMSNYSGGLQPFVQIQKTADANVDYVQVKRIRIEYKQSV